MKRMNVLGRMMEIMGALSVIAQEGICVTGYASTVPMKSREILFWVTKTGGEMSDKPMYSAWVGGIVDAYVSAACACAVARATQTPYDSLGHGRALIAFDNMLARLDEDSDLLDYLDDWFSGGNEIVIRQSRTPNGDRHVEEDKVDGRLVDILYVYEPGGENEDQGETVRDAIRASLKEQEVSA